MCQGHLGSHLPAAGSPAAQTSKIGEAQGRGEEGFWKAQARSAPCIGQAPPWFETAFLRPLWQSKLWQPEAVQRAAAGEEESSLMLSWHGVVGHSRSPDMSVPRRAVQPPVDGDDKWASRSRDFDVMVSSQGSMVCKLTGAGLHSPHPP